MTNNNKVMAVLETAKKLIKNMSAEQLIETWEMTSTSTDENIPMIRGWLMDEFEERDFEGFELWLDTNGEDLELKNYVKL